MKALTPRQAEIHAFMLRFQRENGLPPTLDELAEAVGVGKRGAHDHLLRLMKKGAVKQHAKAASRGYVAVPIVPTKSFESTVNLADPVRGAKRTAGVDAKVLDYIGRHPGCTWRDILAWRGWAIGTAKSAVERLVDRQLVERDAADRLTLREVSDG